MKKKLILSALGITLVMGSNLPAFAEKGQVNPIKSYEFIGSSAPSTAAEMGKVFTNAKVEVTYANGEKKVFPLSYNTLFKSTDTLNGVTAGQAIDAMGKPIIDNSVPSNPIPFVSDDPDANSLMQIEGAPLSPLGGNALNLVTHYEYITKKNDGSGAWGQIPASMSLASIDQDKETGRLKATGLKKINFAQVDGLWIPCNGSLSPWNTHLASEEYEADAREFEADPNKTMVPSFAKYYFNDEKQGNPYAYGYIPEVTVKADGTATVVKHYSMGRFSHELSKVMPDNRTVYFGDDGKNTMLFMYIADRQKDLSAGTLYAAKWKQLSDQNGGSAALEWIKLGHATDSEIRSFIDQKMKFSDIFETAVQDTEGFTKIQTYPSNKVEWLKVKPGMEKAAAFLESRRYGAILGATSEFNKMEGITLNAKDKKVYVAISYLSNGMEQAKESNGLQDDIRLPKINAGATFELSLQPGQKDRDNYTIASEYVATSMSALVVGVDLPRADDKGNTANVDFVANPDNLSFSEDMRTLFIGEDSGTHTNNFLWAYNVDTKKLSRVLSLPAGAEGTGLQAVDNMNGFSYVMSNLQHPGDYETEIPEPLKSQIDAEINRNFDNKRSGLIGYINGFPKFGDKVKKSTLIPVRVISEALGASILWDEETSTVTIVKGSASLSFKVGESTIHVNGETVNLDEASENKVGKAMLPANVLIDFLLGN